MNSNDKVKLQNQFGSFCTKVLKNEMKSIQREYTKIRNREVSLESLYNDRDAIELSYFDNYFRNAYVVDVYGLPVIINGDYFAKAMLQLPEMKRSIILLSYFLRLSDREIGELINVGRKSVYKHRRDGLEILRENFEKEDWCCDSTERFDSR